VTTGKIYFSKDHENAIVEYAKTKDLKVRQKLYIELIGPAFNEMVDKMVFTYKFTSLPNIDDLKDECKVWLTTILDKFDPSKGSKAFSYFSVITKNWFIHKVKKNTQQSKKEVYFEEMDGENNLVNQELIIHNTYYDERSDQEFWKSLWTKMDEWENEDLKINEKRVLSAIKTLLENSDKIEIFNKKAVYMYIRDLTNLNTKQIANNLNRLRERYSQFKHEWDEQ
jgi:DNA-directed RNA polymerase specialized sigma subunit